MAGIPTSYRERRDSKPRSWYAKQERPFYGGVPRRRKYSRRKTVLKAVVALISLYWTYSYLLSPGEPILVARTNVTMRDRQERVKAAFVESWKAYEEHGFGHDEYHPVAKTHKDMVPGGMGWIIIDSLDTMLLMELQEYIPKARTWVEEHSFDVDAEVNVFETTIRMLGGLLSCFNLEQDVMYLNKAIDLGDRLLGAYNTSSGIPTASVNLRTGKPVESHDDGGASSTAEVATLQLEMKYLSFLSGDDRYGIAAERVMERLRRNQVAGGLVPIFVHPSTGAYRGTEIRLGSRGDSYYEYLAKQWLANDDPVYRESYEEVVQGIKDHLIGYSSPSRWTYIGELHQGIGAGLSSKMDHLVCFLPGTLALGATRGLPLLQAKKESWFGTVQEEDMKLASQLTRTCFEMYNCTTIGLAPEIVYFVTDPESPSLTSDCPDIQINSQDRHNLMRPETVESLFIMWRITREEKYRDWAWQIFLSFEAYLHAGEGLGFTSINNVMANPPPKRDNMESFWLAETLKYLYLTFAQTWEEADTSLEHVIFNTEAHLIPKFRPLIGSRGGDQRAWVDAHVPSDASALPSVEHVEEKSTDEAFLQLKRLHIDIKAAQAEARSLKEGKSASAAKKEGENVAALLQKSIHTMQMLKEHERADMMGHVP